MIWTWLLVAHDVVAAALLGMVTHQVAGILFRGRKTSFAGSYSAVRALLFTDAIVVTFVVNFALGGWIYTRYRYTARPVLEDLDLRAHVGAFEFKEHLLAVALFTLPAYWLFWHKVPFGERSTPRTALTLFVGCSVWVAFVVGHVVNNARGI